LLAVASTAVIVAVLATPLPASAGAIPNHDLSVAPVHRPAPAGPSVSLDLTNTLTPTYNAGLSVFNLYWDSTWDSDHPGATRSTINAATSALFGSPYPSSLTQYSVPATLGFRGSAQAVSFCGSSPGSMTSTPTLLLFMICEEATPGDGVPFAVAFPGDTTNIIYNVILPVGTNISDTITNPFNGNVIFRNGSCNSGVIPVGGGAIYGAYHALAPGLPIPLVPLRTIFFTIIPADCAKVGGSLSVPKLMTLISHEVVEASTDPVPLLYWINLLNSGTTGGLFSALVTGEAADECENTFGAVPFAPSGIAMTVNAYWSNAVHACVVGGSRVVSTTFTETGVPPSLTTATIAGVSRSLNGSLTEAELEGTSFAFPSEIDDGAGVRYVLDSCTPSQTGTVAFPAGNITADASENITCAYHKEVTVSFNESGIPGGVVWQVTVNGVVHDGPFSDFFPANVPINFSYQSPVPGAVSGTRYVLLGTNVASPVSVFTPTAVIGTYQTQHLLTVSTSGLGSSFTHVFNGGTLLGMANDSTPVSVWLPSGTSLHLAVDSPVAGPGGMQFIFQGFVPPPPATLTAPFGTVAVYLSVAQMIANAVASGGIYGPGANGIANSLTQKFSNVQDKIARGDLTAALGQIKAFVNEVNAQTGKHITPATAAALDLAALSVFHSVLCQALASGQITPAQASSEYAWYAAQVTSLGGTPLPPC
jgi:hypothetical protein